jgi:hypothetical protein
MKKIILIASFVLILLTSDAFCQKGPARFFGDPILTDTLSTLFIPTRYNEDFMSSNKIAIWGDYYANIVVYNHKVDSYQKLFESDTFIEPFRMNNDDFHGRTVRSAKNRTAKWVFLLVKIKDTNKSRRIDENDPSVLFAVSTKGEDLKQLTEENENVVSFENYDQQGFILIKIQKDSGNDGSFRNEDKEFYFRKVNLTDLSIGKPIELK